MTTKPVETLGNPYATLPHEGPYEVAIGRALITMVEPNEGHDSEYNRWYEDDHFYSGATAMPWVFAGRRWVAPRDLQALRYPEDSTVARPLSAGKYISVYWITAGRYEDNFRWMLATYERSLLDRRINFDWKSVYTSFQVYAGVVYRDSRGSRDIHALDYPYQGLVVEVINPTESREALEQWLREEHLPRRLAGSPVAMTLMFEPEAMQGEGLPGREQSVTLLSFVEARPSECWSAVFAGAGDAIAASGRGRVLFAAPFYPTLPGTDIYVDQLR